MKTISVRSRLALTLIPDGFSRIGSSPTVLIMLLFWFLSQRVDPMNIKEGAGVSRIWVICESGFDDTTYVHFCLSMYIVCPESIVS